MVKKKLLLILDKFWSVWSLWAN